MTQFNVGIRRIAALIAAQAAHGSRQRPARHPPAGSVRQMRQGEQSDRRHANQRRLRNI